MKNIIKKIALAAVLSLTAITAADGPGNGGGYRTVVAADGPGLGGGYRSVVEADGPGAGGGYRNQPAA